MDKEDIQEPSVVNGNQGNEEHVTDRISPLLRTMSLANSDIIKVERKRSRSECSCSTDMRNVNYHNASYNRETDDISLRQPRHGPISSLLSGVQRKATSLIFSDPLTRKYEENLMSASVHDISMDMETHKPTESGGLANTISFPEAPREVSQTDHLNKRLLDSFLSRINSMSSAIVGPTCANEGEIYTDDLLMDRILHRVESENGQ